MAKLIARYSTSYCALTIICDLTHHYASTVLMQSSFNGPRSCFNGHRSQFDRRHSQIVCLVVRLEVPGNARGPWWWFHQCGPKAWLDDSIADCCSVPSAVHYCYTPRENFLSLLVTLCESLLGLETLVVGTRMMQ